MIDTHCHLDFFDNCAAIIDASNKKGIDEFIVPAISRSNWEKLFLLQSPKVHVAYGIHPWFLNSDSIADLKYLSTWINNKNPIAIGECGLDYYLDDFDKDLQHRVFIAQLKLAKQLDLPVVVHSRKAVADVLTLCQSYSINKVVLHGFSGSIQQSQQAIKLGMYIGVGLIICNPKATKIRAMVASLPLTSILLETDSPNHNNKNDNLSTTPEFILKVAKELSIIKQISFTEVIQQCKINAIKCFNLSN